jgi:hypothetical protein
MGDIILKILQCIIRLILGLFTALGLLLFFIIGFVVILIAELMNLIKIILKNIVPGYNPTTITPGNDFMDLFDAFGITYKNLWYWVSQCWNDVWWGSSNESE